VVARRCGEGEATVGRRRTNSGERSLLGAW
jgi:hypothetical protein